MGLGRLARVIVGRGDEIVSVERLMRGRKEYVNWKGGI